MATQASDSRYRLRTSASDELAVIAQRAQAFTNASGAAIALNEGNAEEIVCRARSGSSAPDVGVSLRVENSFTGLCIQSGKELRCDDAETDTRVDSAAIRALGIRSMVVTPVKEDNKVVGVLAVFAPTAHAFTITHVAVLKTMADQISALLVKERRAQESAHAEPIVAAPKPAAAAAAPPPPVVIKSSNSGAAAATAPARVNGSAAHKVEPVKPAVEAPAPVPFPKREEKKREEKRPEPRIEAKAEPAVKPNFGTFDAVGEERKSQGGSKFMLVGVAVVVVAIAGVSWMFLKKGTPAPSQQASSAVAPAPAANPQPSPASSAPSSSATNPAVNSTPAAPAQQPVASTSQNSKATQTESKSDKKKTESAKSENQPAAAPTPATVALSSGPSRINPGSAALPQPAGDVAPSLAVGGSGSSSTLSSLAAPTGTSKVSMMAQSELVNAKLTKTVPAVYPPIAQARRITGTVALKVKVGKDGKVRDPQFESGPIIFRDAAFEAVRQWQYKPATLNGQPIEQEQEIRMSFHP